MNTNIMTLGFYLALCKEQLMRDSITINGLYLDAKEWHSSIFKTIDEVLNNEDFKQITTSIVNVNKSGISELGYLTVYLID